MLEIKPSSARRWKTADVPGGLRIVIPVRRQWFVVLFLPVWLGLWAVAEGKVIGTLLDGGSEQPAFLLFWFIGWTFGGLWATAFFLWQLAGETRLEMGPGYFRHRQGIGPLAIGRTYDASKIRNLRANELGEAASSWIPRSGPSWLGRGVIAFDYGERSCSIRPGLEPTEARNVVNLLSRYLEG